MIENKKYITLESTLVILYLLVGFLPYFDAIDKIAPQFFYLSILNIISSVFVINKYDHLKFKYFSYPFISLLSFLIWSFCSYFYAVNQSEVLIETSRIVIYLFSFVFFYILIYNKKEILKFIPYLISIILIIEVGLVLERFFERFTFENYSRDLGLRAFTGNINITAFNFLIKLPFLLIVLSRSKVNVILKYISLTTFTFTLFLLGSRGANLSYILILILSIIISIYFSKSSFLFKKQIVVLLFALISGGTINFFLFQDNKSLNVIQRSSDLQTSSTQQRLRFYKAAIQSIKEQPLFGVGIGNWKIHATKYDKPYMIDYTVPYHVHNEFLEVTAETGVIGFILFFGIFFWIAYLIFSAVKSREYLNIEMFYLILACSVSLIAYLSDSFINFPFERPVIFVQILFYIVIILVVLNDYPISTNPISIKINQTGFVKKTAILFLVFSGLSFSSIISFKVFESFKQQQFLTAAGNGTFTNYTKQYVESIDSDIPSITATTIPIETLKANLIYNIKELNKFDDTLHFMIEQGKSQNPFLPYNELTKSVLFIKQEKPDSAYIYAKKAFYELPNHTVHFDLLMDIAEAFKDSIEVDKAINSIKNIDLRNNFYEKYLTVSYNIKNQIGLTESEFLDKYSVKNPNSDAVKVFNVLREVGIEKIEEGIYESNKANQFFIDKKFQQAAKSFLKASEFNPLEVSYYENAANSYMQLGEDDKAIEVLNDVIQKLNPKTGKAEYLLGIIYIGQQKFKKGCEALNQSKNKGFNVPETIFERFCNLTTQK